MLNARVAAVLLGLSLASCTDDPTGKPMVPWNPFPELDAGNVGSHDSSVAALDAGEGDATPESDAAWLNPDSGLDGSAADAAEGSEDAGGDAGGVHADGGVHPDGGAEDAGSEADDAATEPDDAGADAGGEFDAGDLMDAGSEPDAGQAIDAGGAIDAGAIDAGPGTDPDAGREDAGAEPDAGPSCGPPSATQAGNSCPGVVTCQDNNGQDVPACTLQDENGATGSHCCVGLTNSNSCRASACDFGQGEATCDGPEDCSGGRVCCRSGFSTSCETNCSNSSRLCHTDADCPANARCQAGASAGTFRWWGFCRG